MELEVEKVVLMEVGVLLDDVGVENVVLGAVDEVEEMVLMVEVVLMEGAVVGWIIAVEVGVTFF